MVERSIVGGVMPWGQPRLNLTSVQLQVQRLRRQKIFHWCIYPIARAIGQHFSFFISFPETMKAVKDEAEYSNMRQRIRW